MEKPTNRVKRSLVKQLIKSRKVRTVKELEAALPPLHSDELEQYITEHFTLQEAALLLVLKLRQARAFHQTAAEVSARNQRSHERMKESWEAVGARRKTAEISKSKVPGGLAKKKRYEPQYLALTRWCDENIAKVRNSEVSLDHLAEIAAKKVMFENGRRLTIAHSTIKTRISLYRKLHNQ
jgi:hypothetical protein